MRTKIEAVLNNKDAKAQDYFELVNIYECSQVTLQRDGKDVISMDINEVEAYPIIFLAIIFLMISTLRESKLP